MNKRMIPPLRELVLFWQLRFIGRRLTNAAFELLEQAACQILIMVPFRCVPQEGYLVSC